MSQLIKELPWDSNHFKVKIGRYLPTTIADPDQEKSFRQEFFAGKFDCVYAMLDASDVHSREAAARNQFFLGDIRMSYALTKKDWFPKEPQRRQGTIPAEIRFLNPDNAEQVAQVKVLSRDLSVVSRFHFDERFRPYVADMYEIWAGNFIKPKTPTDLPVKTVIALKNGWVAGFIGNKIVEEEKDGQKVRHGEVVLVATHSDFRGQGFGRAMSEKSIDWCFEQGAEFVTVDTQGNNYQASRLYESVGFRLQDMKLIYHVWKQYGFNK